MPKFLQLLKQSTFAALAVFLLLTFCPAQGPTSKAQPKPPRPAAGPRAVRATLAAVVPRGKPCPVTVNLNGTITTNGAAEVKYTWASSDNSTWPKHTITFAKAGTEKVTEHWQLNKNYTAWVQLKVVGPNAISSPRANFKVTCGSSAGPGKVTRATLAASVPRGSACPVTVNFNGTVSTNDAAAVKYTWVSYDGGTWPENTLKFGKAGIQKVNEQRQVAKSQNGWMQLKVLSPNAVVSPRANYKVRCPTQKSRK